MAEELGQNIIISVKTDTSEAEQGLDNLSQKLGEVNNSPLEKPFKSLKSQIREATLEAQKMAEEFGRSSTQFATAAKRVEELKDEFQEVNQAVAAFNPDNKLQAMVNAAKGATGAIQGVTGAMTFLGIESGTATETMAKLQGLMAFSDALNSVDDINNSFKNFGAVIQSTSAFQKANAIATNLAAGAMRLFGLSADATSTSFKALRAAIASTGIGLIVVAIATLLPKITEWISGTKDAEKAQKSLESAIESLNRDLDVNLKAIDNATERQIAYAKIAGKSEAEITQLTVNGLKERSKAALDASNKADAAYQKAVKTEGIKNEDIEKFRKEAADKYSAYLDSVHAIEKSDLDQKVKTAEEQRKNEKEASDKADAESKKKAAERKAAFEKQRAETKQALDEINKINEEAKKKISESGLSDLGKELAELQYSFDEKKKKFLKYGSDISTITNDYNFEKAAIEKKYADEATQFILEQTGTEYEIQKAEINKKYEEQIKNATGFADQLISLRDKKLKELEDKKAQEDALKSANSTATQSETTLINTQVDNRILKTDTPDERKTKLSEVAKVFSRKVFEPEVR